MVLIAPKDGGKFLHISNIYDRITPHLYSYISNIHFLHSLWDQKMCVYSVYVCIHVGDCMHTLICIEIAVFFCNW